MSSVEGREIAMLTVKTLQGMRSDRDFGTELKLAELSMTLKKLHFQGSVRDHLAMKMEVVRPHFQQHQRSIQIQLC